MVAEAAVILNRIHFFALVVGNSRTKWPDFQLTNTQYGVYLMYEFKIVFTISSLVYHVTEVLIQVRCGGSRYVRVDVSHQSRSGPALHCT